MTSVYFITTGIPNGQTAAIATALDHQLTALGYGDVHFAECEWSQHAVSHIRRAGIVVALIESLSPSVGYELGCALSLGKPLLLITTPVVDIPPVFADIPSLRIEFTRPEVMVDVVDAVDRLAASLVVAPGPPETAKGKLQTYESDPVYFDRLTYHEFVDLVRWWFQEHGCQPAFPSSPAAGFDVALSAYRDKRLTLVEIKKQERGARVSVDPVRRLAAAVDAERADGGILITTGRFTSAAIDFAAKCRPPIELWTIPVMLDVHSVAHRAEDTLDRSKLLFLHDADETLSRTRHANNNRSSVEDQKHAVPRTLVKRPRILLVEKEPSIVRAMTVALTRAGYEVSAATTGEGALEALRTQPVDLLLLELRIPDMRGDVIFHLASAMQSQLRKQTLFITGDVTEQAMELIEACHCPLLMKPFDLQDLTAAVAIMMERRKTLVTEQDAQLPT